jgi:alcohol dehydrogenase
VQVGLLVGEEAKRPLPMGAVIGRELEIYGSHGLAAVDYRGLLDLVSHGDLDPRRLVRRVIPLSETPAALVESGAFQSTGITVIDPQMP